MKHVAINILKSQTYIYKVFKKSKIVFTSELEPDNLDLLFNV